MKEMSISIYLTVTIINGPNEICYLEIKLRLHRPTIFFCADAACIWNGAQTYVW